jgi:hypothetical protein
MRKLAFYVTAPLKGATQSYLIRIFKVSANRQSAGKARNVKAHRFDQAG